MSEERFVADIGGMRLDQFLAKRRPNYSRNHFKELVLRGCVRVDGVARPPDFRLAGGELIGLRWPESAWPAIPFEDLVLHEDKDILVIHKPAGLIAHPIAGSWLTEARAALDDPEPSVVGLMLKHRPAVVASGVSRCGLVHRLDRQTSGVLVLAKRPAAQETLLEAFREREVRKVYRAVVLGEFLKKLVDAPIGRRPGGRKVSVTPWGRESSTAFSPLASAGGLSMIQAEPKTGRTHQIRAHLALIKHPVLGDFEWFLEPEKARLAALGLPPPPRMLLHAYRLRLAHPSSGKEVSFTARLPADFREYWRLAEEKC